MIYFVRSGDAVKIGYAAEPEKRIPSLRTGNPNEIVVLGLMDGDYDTERELHERFAHRRIRGEWFDIGDDVLAFIQQNCRPYFLGMRRINIGPPPAFFGRVSPDSPWVPWVLFGWAGFMFPGLMDYAARTNVLPETYHMGVVIMSIVTILAGFVVAPIVYTALGLVHATRLWLYRRAVRRLSA